MTTTTTPIPELSESTRLRVIAENAHEQIGRFSIQPHEGYFRVWDDLHKVERGLYGTEQGAERRIDELRGWVRMPVAKQKRQRRVIAKVK